MAIGWGRDTWGSGTWGIDTAPIVDLTGVSSQGDVGIDADVTLAGVEASSAINSLTIVITVQFALTGLASTSVLNAPVVTGDANIYPIGLSASVLAGNVLVWGLVPPGPVAGWVDVPVGPVGGWAQVPAGPSGGWTQVVT